jgi:hypothetical protein
MNEVCWFPLRDSSLTEFYAIAAATAAGGPQELVVFLYLIDNETSILGLDQTCHPCSVCAQNFHI